MHVMTVYGPVAARDLGITLPHEHLLADSLVWRTPPADEEEAAWADRPVAREMLGLLRRNPLFSRDNLLLDDEDLAVAELRRFQAAGGRTVVDPTSVGLERNIRAIHRIAEKTGLQIVAGCGFYVEATHPPELEEVAVETIAEGIVREIEDGIEGTGIRPGIIGEIGTGLDVT